MELSLVNQGKVCPYCGQETEHVDSIVIYGKSYGMVYRCQDCDAYVGTHKSNPEASKGSVANKELRELRKKAHASFDPIWKGGHMDRNTLYGWLSDKLGIDSEVTHIGMFDEEQCKKVITVCNKYRKEFK